MKKSTSRRSFLRNMAKSSALLGSLPFAKDIWEEHIETRIIQPESTFSANDRVNIALIGCGIQGFADTRKALEIPGVQLVAVCDLYSGRLERAKEVFGQHISTTKDYKSVLSRPDLDAVIIATPDHWHDHISIDALKAGKAVYCEKPMVHHIEEGHAVIQAEKTSGKAYQVGSQGVSSVIRKVARQMIKAGDLGQINMVETSNDRFSANGAWQYSIPTDASPSTIDWDRFLGDAPKHAFDPTRFFRWRNYQDYGTGVAGDLFIHLLSALHITLDSQGPERIYGSGMLSYWKDGRDVPDVMVGLMDYPESSAHPAFKCTLRVNFIDGSGGSFSNRIVGSEGEMVFEWGGFKLKRNKLAKAPGYGNWDSYDTFSSAQQAEYKKWYEKTYPKAEDQSPTAYKEYKYVAPEWYDDHYDHFLDFFDAMRTGRKTIEDATFGLRAAGPAIACNLSHFQKRIIKWDPEKMVEIK